MGPGLMPFALVSAPTLAQATYKAWLACHENGVSVLDVKHVEGTPLGKDISLWIVVTDPEKEPKIFTPGFLDDIVSLEAYRLQVVFGIYDHWVGHGWDYTYHERFADQIVPMIERIIQTWLEKHRISSRDFFLLIGRKDDLGIDDPPCLQTVHIRLIPTGVPSEYKLNLTVVFRSRDLGKAFWENAWALISLQKHLARLINEAMQGYGIHAGIGVFSDLSISSQLYGADEAKWDRSKTIARMKKEPWLHFAMDSRRLITQEDLIAARHLIAAQFEHEKRTGDKKASKDTLIAAGIDWENFPYPPEWDLDL